MDVKLKVIYEPKGRAKEYSNLALNIYNGCSFGCKYCFAPLIMKRDREHFRTEIKERDRFLEKVELDCIKLEGTKDRVLLCFTCDPYNDLDLITETTSKVLQLFEKYNINFQILTKGGSRAERDFEWYKEGDAFAATLTFADETKSIEWEPGAATPNNRMKTLKKAHDVGIETWVSLEPVMDPVESLKIIELTHEYVDLYKVGKLNHNDEIADKIDWKKFANDAIALLEKYGKKYYIKDDLKKYL
jgi:DNA repair photolyase